MKDKDKKLQNRYIIVTGASSGIGKETAIYFASKGHNLIIVARRKELLNNLKKEIENKYKVKVLSYIYDFTDINNVIKFYQEIKNYELEVLINNAGFGDRNDSWDSDLNKTKMMIDLNITSLTILSILFIKDHINRDSQIINISSTAGYKIWSGGVIYSATKFYVSIFSEGTAKILKDKKAKLKMKVFAPSSTKTEFVERSIVKSKVDPKILKESEINRKDYQKDPKLVAKYIYEFYQSDKNIAIVDSKTDKLYLKDKYFKYL